jgi:phosphoglycerate dehydrogenase-like enzyme
LRALPNVFLTSHIAGGSQDMHAAAAAEVVAKVTAWLDAPSSSGLELGRLATMT